MVSPDQLATAVRADERPAAGTPAELASAQLVIVDLAPASDDRSARPSDPLADQNAAARREALAAASNAVDAVALQTAGAVADEAVSGSGVDQSTAGAMPLRILFSPDDEAPAVELDVPIERIDDLVAYCFISGSILRFLEALRVGVAARKSGVDIRSYKPEERGPLLLSSLLSQPVPLTPVPVPEEVALRDSLERLSEAQAETLVTLANRAASRLKERVQEVRQQTSRYAAFVPAGAAGAAPPPQPGSTEGGSGSGADTGSGGGSQTADNAPTDDPQYRLVDGSPEAVNARKLLALVVEVGALVQQHDRAVEDLKSLERKLEFEKADVAGTPDPEQSRAEGKRVADERQKLTSDRDAWQAKALEFSRSETDLIAQGGEQPQKQKAQPSQGTPPGPAPSPPQPARQQEHHPLLPGVLALCIASGPPGSGARFAPDNVIQQVARYLAALDRSAQLAQKNSPASLRAILDSPDARSGPNVFAVRWALDTAGAVSPFASDAILTNLKDELLAELRRPHRDEEVLRLMFEYRVLVSYWEQLIEEREKRASAEQERNDWWVKPTSKLSAFFGLVGMIPPLAALRIVALAIGIGQMVLLMQDTVADAEKASSAGVIEAMLSGDDQRLALALGPNPLIWRLVGELAGGLAAQGGLQAALNLASPQLGLVYDMAQDLLSLVEE